MIWFSFDLVGDSMARFVVGDARSQSTLFPERLDDYLGEDIPVRAVDVFADSFPELRGYKTRSGRIRRCYSTNF